MKVALYIGDHAGDVWYVRLGWWLTRKAQKGPLAMITHCEAIHAENADGTVTIASASLREGNGVSKNGVRTKKNASLAPGNWRIVDVPQYDVNKSIQWFAEHDGELYDIRGALATELPGHADPTRQFCNKALGASVGLMCPETFGPHQFAAIVLTQGKDVTADFFRQVGR